MTMMTTSSPHLSADLAEADSQAEDSVGAEDLLEEEALAVAGKRDGNVSLFLR